MVVFFTAVCLFLSFSCSSHVTIWYSSLYSSDSNWTEGGTGNIEYLQNDSNCPSGTKCYSMFNDAWISRSINAENYISLSLQATVNIFSSSVLSIFTSINGSYILQTTVSTDSHSSGSSYSINSCDGIETCEVKLLVVATGSGEVFIQDVYAQGDFIASSPTGNPSTQPSIIPTFMPTGIPTRLPSGKPTEQPLIIPSLMPTASPSTNNPSNYPTSFPTLYTTLLPSVFPTLLPSGFPTFLPTYIPTILPTHSPTTTTTEDVDSHSHFTEKSEQTMFWSVIIIGCAIFVALIIIVWLLMYYIRLKKRSEIEMNNVLKQDINDQQQLPPQLESKTIDMKSNVVRTDSIVSVENENQSEKVNKSENENSGKNAQSMNVEENLKVTIGESTAGRDFSEETDSSSSDDSQCESMYFGDNDHVLVGNVTQTPDITKDGKMNLLTADGALPISLK